MRGRPPLFLSIGPADCRGTIGADTTCPVGAATTVDCVCWCPVGRFADCRSAVRSDTPGAIDAVGAGYSVCLMGDGKPAKTDDDSER